MIGKKLRINDYKLTYGQGTAYINIYGVFRDSTNGNKYAIYSYEGNNSLFYGTFFKRNKEAVIMISKSNSEESIKTFVDLLLNYHKIRLNIGTYHGQKHLLYNVHEQPRDTVFL